MKNRRPLIYKDINLWDIAIKCNSYDAFKYINDKLGNIIYEISFKLGKMEIVSFEDYLSYPYIIVDDTFTDLSLTSCNTDFFKMNYRSIILDVDFISKYCGNFLFELNELSYEL